MGSGLFFSPIGEKNSPQKKMNFNYENEFSVIQNDVEKVIEFLRIKGVLHRIIYCEGCNEILKEVAYKRNVDEKAFRCYKKQCLYFLKYISIRKNSFFEDYNISLRKLVIACYMWFKNDNQTTIIKDLNLSKCFCQKLFTNIRNKIERYFEINIYKLGGRGIICQIDESMFRYKQKYHVGRFVQGCRWVFGIVDTSTHPGKYYVQLVPDRSADTLIPILRNVCKDGSIIWSDEWRSYNNIENNNFEHQTVNHKFNFVNPIDGCNTQSVESLWNKLKRRIKKLMGVDYSLLNSYLKEWMWKDNIAKNDFNEFLELIK